MADNDYYTRLTDASEGAVSIAMPQVDFPDPASVIATFTYNYFVPNEMVGSSALNIQDPTVPGASLDQTYVASRTRSVLDSTSTPDLDAGFYSVQTNRFPMFNKVCWNPVVVDNPPINQDKVDEIASKLPELIHLAESEESFSSAIYSGYTVSPINIYEAVYRFTMSHGGFFGMASGLLEQHLATTTAAARVMASSLDPYTKVQQIYNLMFGSEAESFSLTSEQSGEEAVSTEISALDQSDITKLVSTLVSVFGNYQTTEAYSSISGAGPYASEVGGGTGGVDTTDQLISYAFASENNVSFGSTVHNALYYDVVKKASEDGLNWHSINAKNVRDSAKDIALGLNDKFTGSTEGMFPIVNPVSVVFPEEDAASSPSADDEIAISPVGYIVEKYSGHPTHIFNLGGGLDDNATFLISPYGDGNELTDSDLIYGNAYNYAVRAVYLAQVPIINRSLISPDDDQFGYAYVLVVSKPNFSNSVQALDTTPPPPPGNMEFIYNYSDQTLFMHWEFPTNKQEDIVAFQVFRRESNDDPFELIAQYDFDESVVPYPNVEQFILPRLISSNPGNPVVSHTDLKFKKNSKYIYAVCSVDARRLSSGYSSQYEVSFDRYRNKLVVKRSSFPGAPKPYPNLYLTKDTFRDSIQTSEYDDFYIFFDPDAYFVKDSGGSDLKLISTSGGSNPDKPAYHMNVINLDMQKSQTIDISINDESNILDGLKTS